MVFGRIFAFLVLTLFLLHVCTSFQYAIPGLQPEACYTHFKSRESGAWGDLLYTRMPTSPFRGRRGECIRLRGKMDTRGGDDHRNCGNLDDRNAEGDPDDTRSKRRTLEAMEDRRGLTKKPHSAIRDEEANQKVDELLKSSDTSFLKILKPSDYKGYARSVGSELTTEDFGVIFRQCAPYIAMHRNTKVVVHIPGHVIKDKEKFEAVLDDISILHLLGVQLILVAGVRELLDEKLKKNGLKPLYEGGMRVTDDDTMNYLKETSGAARFEIESSLARGFRGRPGQSGINVVSGNFLYTAKPLGVRNGIDYKLSGEVRRIEVENINTRLEQGDICMLTSLGYSPSGEVFNVQSETLAAECASKLSAAKIVYLTQGEVLVDTRPIKTHGIHHQSVENSDGYVIMQNLRMGQAVSLLRQHGASSDTKDWTGTLIKDEIARNYLRVVSRSVKALQNGVMRAHLLPAIRGTLLKELYTRDGAGLLISRDVYEGIRQALPSDVRSIEELLRPLEKKGILVPRSRDQLEKDIPNCYLLTRDETVLACGMLKRYSNTHAEVACLAVSPSFQRAGRGETILAYLERRALLLGITDLFLLSTHTMQWFEERGFVPGDPSSLPASREYNERRGSKVYFKKLGSQRDADMQEFLWNVV